MAVLLPLLQRSLQSSQFCLLAVTILLMRMGNVIVDKGS